MSRVHGHQRAHGDEAELPQRDLAAHPVSMVRLRAMTA